MKLTKITTCIQSYGILFVLSWLVSTFDSPASLLDLSRFPSTSLPQQVNKLIPFANFASALEARTGLAGSLDAEEDILSKNLAEEDAKLKGSDSKKREIDTNENDEGESEENVPSEKRNKGNAKKKRWRLLDPRNWRKSFKKARIWKAFSRIREAKKRRLLLSMPPYLFPFQQSYHREEEKDTLPLATMKKMFPKQQEEKDAMKKIFQMIFPEPKKLRGTSYLYPKAMARDIEIGDMVHSEAFGIVFKIKIKDSTINLLGKFSVTNKGNEQYCQDVLNRMVLVHKKKFTKVNPNLRDFSAQSNIASYLDIIRLYGIFDSDSSRRSSWRRLVSRTLQKRGKFYSHSSNVPSDISRRRGFHENGDVVCFDLYVMEEYSQSLDGITAESMMTYSAMKQLSRAASTLHRLNMTHNNIRRSSLLVYPTGKVSLANLDNVSLCEPFASENSDPVKDKAILFDALVEELRSEQGTKYELSKLKNQQQQNQRIIGLSDKSGTISKFKRLRKKTQRKKMTTDSLGDLAFERKSNDIMSIGAVLYEMICGREYALFFGESFVSPNFEKCWRRIKFRDSNLISLILQEEIELRPTDQQIYKVFAIVDIMQKAFPKSTSFGTESCTYFNSSPEKKPTLCDLQRHLYILLKGKLNPTAFKSLSKAIEAKFDWFLQRARIKELENLWIEAIKYLNIVNPQMYREFTNAS